MRWLWIDRIVELVPRQKCVAIKNVSLAEDVLHDHFSATADGDPPAPVLPNPLILEGMAQTAGILVGQANDYQEKVILAKVGRARFVLPALPGYTLRFTATIDRLDELGAATSGTVERIDPATGDAAELAQIALMFSHVDRNRAGLAFPDFNFVFNATLMDLLRQSGLPAPEAPR